MAEWVHEAGIGEARAALIEDGAILEAAIEPEGGGIRPGAIAEARLTRQMIARRRGIATLASGEELLLEPIPSGVSEGATLLVEIVRAAIPEPGKPKLALACPAPAGAHSADGPDLLARIRATGIPVATLAAHQPDRLEAAGWSELLEEAATGEIAFPGGALRVSWTQAMTLIDVDGVLPPTELANAGARAAGQAIRRMGIAGSIGIDLPTLADRAERQAAAAALDEALPRPFERTAVNGFGFVQIVRRRERASLVEIIRHDPIGAAARALLRRAERAAGTGALVVRAHPAVAALLEARPDWIAELARRRGAAVSVRADPELARDAGQAVVAAPR